jgi:hypothetical protein
MTIFVSALVSVLTTLFLFLFQPWLKKAWMTRNFHIRLSKGLARHGMHVNLRAENQSQFTIGQAGLYITINHQLSDLMNPTDGVEVFHPPGQDAALIDDCGLCWSSRSPKGPTPANIDIYSKESQSFSPFCIYEYQKLVEVPSEAGWLDDKPVRNRVGKFVRHSRAFLKWNKYTGIIKIVSNETFGKSYRFEFDPENREEPMKLTPIHQPWFRFSSKSRT